MSALVLALHCALGWTHPLKMNITGGLMEGGVYTTGDTVTITWDYDPSYSNVALKFWIYYKEDYADYIGSSGTDADLYDGTFSYTIPLYFSTHEYWFLATEGSSIRGISPFHSDWNSNFGYGPTFTIRRPDNCTNHDDCVDTGFGDTYCDRNLRCSYCDECLRWYDAYDFVCPAKCGTPSPFNQGDSIPAQSEDETVGSLQDYVVPGCPGYALLVNATNPQLYFAPDSSRLMTARLRDKLDTLATTVAGDARFAGLSVIVHEAYKTPPADPADATLQNEGRGAVIGLTVIDPQQATSVTAALLTATLGRLAAFAGLDWVKFSSADRLYVSVLPAQCSGPVDLVLLIDGSGSINLPRFGGDVVNFDDKIKEFGRRLLPYFNWGTTDSHSRFAMVTFASSVTVNFRLGDYNTEADLLNSINAIDYPFGGTYLSNGLATVRTDVLAEGNGVRAPEVGIPRVVIVITDGVASRGYEPLQEATELRSAPTNAKVFAMGVGLRYSYSQLVDTASEPASTYVHTVKTFDRISAVVDQITATACRAPIVIVPGNDGVVSIQPCEFKYLFSECGHLSESVVEVTTITGGVYVYVDNSTQPGPFHYQYKDESNNDIKSITVLRAEGDTSPLYVGVKGIDPAGSTFTVKIWSNIFTEGTQSSVAVPEDTPVGNVIFNPTTAVIGAQYGITSGNDDGKFSINSATGTVELVSALDYETTTYYVLRISAVSSLLACQNGISILNISVGNVNDNLPTFGNLPGSARAHRTDIISTEVFQVDASDADGSLTSLTYSLTSTNRRSRRANGTPFAIDNSGRITTDASLMDETGTHDLTVSVSDGSSTVTSSLVVEVDDCSNCPSGYYQSTVCGVGQRDPVCTILQLCQQGQFAVEPVLVTEDRSCLPCPTGEYQDQQDHTIPQCIPHQTCTPPEVLLQEGTDSSDAICGVNSIPPSNSPSTSLPTDAPTTIDPTVAPTHDPTGVPTFSPTTPVPTSSSPSNSPSSKPTTTPSFNPSPGPTLSPSSDPTWFPSSDPTSVPSTPDPTESPTTKEPTVNGETFPPTVSTPTSVPSGTPTGQPSKAPTISQPTAAPITPGPTTSPTPSPSPQPTKQPTKRPSQRPTLLPTPNPSIKPTTEPTPQPTTEPTPKPTIEPTPKPTMQPTTQPPKSTTTSTKGPEGKGTESPTQPPSFVIFGDKAESDDAKADSSEMTWWPALLVLVILILLLLFLLLRRRGEKKEDPEAGLEGLNPLYGGMITDKDVAAAALLGPYLDGDEPLYVLAEEENSLYGPFRRCIAFDHMYYGNKPLALDDDALKNVYALLAMRTPPESSYAPLRTLTRRFLDTTVEAVDPNEHVLDDVCKFISDAAADDLVERVIDSITNNEPTILEPVYELGGASPVSDEEPFNKCFKDLCEDYVPEDNRFLVPVDSDPMLRQLPQSNTQAVYDMGMNADYNEANFCPSDQEYSESAPMEDMYALASGNAKEDMYEMASGIAGADQPDQDNIYAVASGDQDGATNASKDAIYDLGGASGKGIEAVYELGGDGGQEPVGSSGRGEAIYDMGTATEQDRVYDMGSAFAATTESIIPAIYAQASDTPVDASAIPEYDAAAGEGTMTSTSMYTPSEDFLPTAVYDAAAPDVIGVDSNVPDNLRHRSDSYAGALEEDDEPEINDAGYVDNGEYIDTNTSVAGSPDTAEDEL